MDTLPPLDSEKVSQPSMLNKGQVVKKKSITRSGKKTVQQDPHSGLKDKIRTAFEILEAEFIGYSQLHFAAAIVMQLQGGKMLLIGKHGRGKSSFARAIARMGNQSFVSYDASKADSNTLAGFLDPRQAKEGEGMPFIKHNCTIWNKQVVFIDELNRASHQNQNSTLEILEEKTLWGWKLDQLDLVIAAANSGAGYHATLNLDAALFDRFSGVLMIREEHLSEEQLVQLLLKPAELVHSGSLFDENDRHQFRQITAELEQGSREVFAHFSAEFILAVQQFLTYEFSDRTVLQFRDTFFAFLALRNLTETTFQEAVQLAFSEASYFTLFNKALGAETTYALNHAETKIERTLNDYLKKKSKEISGLLTLNCSHVSDPMNWANKMFIGTDSHRLDIFEKQFETIQSDELAENNAVMAIEEVISHHQTGSLTRIANGKVYRDDLRIGAELARLRNIVDRDFYNAYIKEAQLSVDAFSSAVELTDSDLMATQRGVLKAMAANPELVTDDEVDNFNLACATLKYGILKEVLQNGLLLLHYHGETGIYFKNLPLLPRANEQILFRLLPFLVTLDQGTNSRLSAIVKYKNGFRKTDDVFATGVKDVETLKNELAYLNDTFYLLPSFLLPNYFAMCQRTPLRYHQRESIPSQILTQLAFHHNLLDGRKSSTNPHTIQKA